MPTVLCIVDAFTNVRFAGNPAAVCLLSENVETTWMQNVAKEMNLSETAFMSQRSEGLKDGFDLRWFTPLAEVDLCGHATLAGAHILWERGILPKLNKALFHTRSGVLTAKISDGWIEMDFPALVAKTVPSPPNFQSVLAFDPVWVGWNGMDYLVELSSPANVRDLAPDYTVLSKLDTRGIIVTARSEGESDVDFVSRFFAPRYGIKEDPVTGSAHCSLGPYWASKLDRNELVGRQLSSRGGDVRVLVDGTRVRLSGKAVTVLRGELV
ncbi:MAG: putative isomerase YddE [Alphaproteobacteria bacterium MarineAlpha9_Bin7]|nr:MAG: putative isomerase YddE [Alphaproteobacteria bacterium MarineAlpha9_Bin7]